MTNQSTNTTPDRATDNQPTVNEQLDKILGNLWDTAINIGSGSDWNRNKITEAKAKLQRLMVEARLDEVERADCQYNDGAIPLYQYFSERTDKLEKELEDE